MAMVFSWRDLETGVFICCNFLYWSNEN